MREVKRNTKKIRGWMLDHDEEVGLIAGTLDVHYSLVSNTIAGRKDNRKVLRYLLYKGCPKKYLDLPKDLQKAA